VVGGTAVRGLLRAAWDGVGAALRYFNVFGPSAGGEQVPSRPTLQRGSCGTCSLGRRPTIPGGAQRMQDLLFVDDAVYATLLAATTPPRRRSGVTTSQPGRPHDLSWTWSPPVEQGLSSGHSLEAPGDVFSVPTGEVYHQAEPPGRARWDLGAFCPGLDSGERFYGGGILDHAEPYAGKTAGLWSTRHS